MRLRPGDLPDLPHRPIVIPTTCAARGRNLLSAASTSTLTYSSFPIPFPSELNKSKPVGVDGHDRSIRVLIADDHPIIRELVRTTLEKEPHFCICCEVENGAQAVEKAKELKPDVVVLNVTMPVMNGFDAARKIKAEVPDTAIVILSNNIDKGFLEIAQKIGVRAYVAKSKMAQCLVNTVEAAVQGDGFMVA